MNAVIPEAAQRLSGMHNHGFVRYLEACGYGSRLSRFEAVGVEILPAERRTRDYLAKMLPGAVEKSAAVVKAGGLAAD